MNGDRHPFEYAVLRVMPRVERGESINGGVVVYCRELDYLGAEHVQAVLRSIADTCRDGGNGPASAEAIGRRFRWLTAPRSTVVQAGPVHTGLTVDPAAETERLLRVLVLALS
jgi:hypothetical protein